MKGLEFKMAVRKQDVAEQVASRAPTMADLADRHQLYEDSVQDVEEECEFVSRAFRKIRGRDAHSFREDFCGTASASCEWVRQGPERSAIGVDIEPEVLDWGRDNRLNRLTDDQRARLVLYESDVMTVETPPVDVVGAFNFSYFIFKSRSLMKQYFESVYRSLKDDGVFILDAFGGYEAFEEMKEKTKYENFSYVWDQAKYYPVTGEILCHIHFKFPDGSKMKKAFSYDWRLWTLPEVREMLEESGFRKVTVHWEGDDGDGGGDGVFTPNDKGEADAGWIAYITAER
jgi:SAM-dependent methyltransferase